MIQTVGQKNYDADLQQEYQASVRKLLGERFLYFCIAVAVVTCFQVFIVGYADVIQPLWRWILQGRDAAGASVEVKEAIRLPGAEQLLNVFQMIVDSTVYGVVGYLAYRRGFGKDINAGREQLSGRRPDALATDLIRINGAIAMLAYAIVTRAPSNPLGAVFQAHLIACILMPWTWHQALRTVMPLLILNAILVGCFYGGWFDVKLWPQKLVSIVSSPLIVLPGIAVALIKHTASLQRFRTRFLEDRYGQMSKEISAARAIHDALYPASGERYGPFELGYRHTPKKDLGGDYLFARWVPRASPAARDGGGTAPAAEASTSSPDPGQLHLVVLDVTGHGISAALTVSRVHGEIERLYGENPDIEPAALLASLNRYVELTMASHSIFVTGIVVTIDTESERLLYAAGGHPPAFIRRASGKVEMLETMSTVLGALGDAEFQAVQSARHFGPGDALIAYTDGAIEAMGHQGDLFGVPGVARTLITAGASDGTTMDLPGAVIRAVDLFRAGPATDDVLVVQVAWPHRSAPDLAETDRSAGTVSTPKSESADLPRAAVSAAPPPHASPA